MGWWWSSRHSGQETTAKEPFYQNRVQVSSPEAPLPELVPIPKSSEAQSQDQPLTSEGETDRELISWLKEIQSEAADRKPPSPKSQPFTTRSSQDISPDSLYPTEISCRSAFDYAFFCQSFGGQFV